MRRLIFILLMVGLLDCQAQSVPDTDTFCLSDVTSVVGCTCLADCFANAIDANFDPVYKGSKDRLSNFRNYHSTLYYSDAIYTYYRRNNCASGYHGTYYLVDYPAGMFTSSISHEDANAQATAAAQADANTYGDCEADWGNQYTQCQTSKDDCPDGYYSPEVYNGYVSENTFYSDVSQEDANNQAYSSCMTDIQAYANENGTCVEDCAINTSFRNDTDCNVLSNTTSCACNGLIEWCYDYTGGCAYLIKFEIYNTLNQLIATEYNTGTVEIPDGHRCDSGPTWISTPLYNGYTVIIVLY